METIALTIPLTAGDVTALEVYQQNASISENLPFKPLPLLNP